MVREIITPKSDTYTIKIPREYIDQEVELLLFSPTQDVQKEVKKSPKRAKKIENLGGCLSEYANPTLWHLGKDFYELGVVDEWLEKEAKAKRAAAKKVKK